MCVCRCFVIWMVLAARLLCLLAMMSSCSLCYRKSQREIVFCECCSCMHSVALPLIVSMAGKHLTELQINQTKTPQKCSTVIHKHKAHCTEINSWHFRLGVVGFVLLKNVMVLKCSPHKFIETKTNR